MLSGHGPSTWNLTATPRKHAASERTTCFRGDTARAMLFWAIRESMAPAQWRKSLT